MSRLKALRMLLVSTIVPVYAAEPCPRHDAAGEPLRTYEGTLALAGCTLMDLKRFACYPTFYPNSEIPTGSGETTKEIKLEYDNARKHRYILPVFKSKTEATVIVCGAVVKIDGKPRFDVWNIGEVTHNKLLEPTR